MTTQNRQNKSNTSANMYNSTHANNENKSAHRDTTHARDKKDVGKYEIPSPTQPADKIAVDTNSDPIPQKQKEQNGKVNDTPNKDIYDPTAPNLSEDVKDIT